MSEINSTQSDAQIISLQGRVALITASTTGLGKVMARALGAVGAKVALNYANNKERAEKTLCEFN